MYKGEKKKGSPERETEKERKVYIIRIGIVHYCSRATQVVNDNEIKNVLSLTTRVASIVAK